MVAEPALDDEHLPIAEQYRRLMMSSVTHSKAQVRKVANCSSVRRRRRTSRVAPLGAGATVAQAGDQLRW
ncbi:hypothetical protein [Streptomyces sp. NPDC054765]